MAASAQPGSLGAERARVHTLIRPLTRHRERASALPLPPRLEGLPHRADPNRYFGPKTSMATRPALTAQGQPA